MKKAICLVLCLSVIFTLILGITTASAASVAARAGYTKSGYKVTGTGYDAESRRGFFTHLKVYLKVDYVRGPGMTNEGQVYYKNAEKEKKPSTRWTEVKSVSVTVYGKNAADGVKDVLCYARKWWTVD